MYAYCDECWSINAYSQNLSAFHKTLKRNVPLRLVRLPVHVLGCSYLFIYFYGTQYGISTTQHSKNRFTASLSDSAGIRSHIAHCRSLHQSPCEICSSTSGQCVTVIVCHFPKYCKGELN